MIYKLYIQPDDIFDSFVHISPNNRISSGGNVCPKNIDIAWAIAITSPQKFDHRSSQSVAIRVVLQSNVNVNKGFRVHSISGARCDCQKTKSNRYNEFPFGFAVHIKVRIHQKCLPIILSLLSQMIAPIIIWAMVCSSLKCALTPSKKYFCRSFG